MNRVHSRHHRNVGTSGSWLKSLKPVLAAALIGATCTTASAQIGGTGWVPAPVTFHVQSPTNAPQDERYWFTNNIYHCLVYSNDGPFSIGSTTLPRTEQRFTPDYTSGEIQYQSMEMAPSNENSYCLFQIHTGNAQLSAYGSTTFMLFWFASDGGSVHDYSGTELAKNLGNKWFQLNVDHNLATRTIKVWINRNLVWTQEDNGAGDFYFKDGVYEQNHNPTYEMDTCISNILIWTNSGSPVVSLVWDGGSATDSDWSDPANWGGAAIAPGDALTFAGTTRLYNVNDTAANTGYSNIVFNPGAGAFLLTGNPITLSGTSIVNNSTNPQTIYLGLNFNNAQTFDAGTAGLVLGSGITNSSAALHLQGTNGILGGPLQGSLGVTLDYTSGASNCWSLVGNDTSYLTNLIVAGDSMSIGTGSDSPSVAITNDSHAYPLEVGGMTTNITSVLTINSGTLTAENSSEQPLEVGANGSTGIINVKGGTLDISGKYIQIGDTGGTGIINQSGGTVNANAAGDFILGNQTNATGILNVSGGTFNIPNNAYVGFRGAGTWNISSNGTIVAGTVSMTRDNSDSLNASGTINLNSGGTLVMGQEAMGNSGSGQTGAINLNGGVLLAATNSTSFITPPSSPSELATPVQVGGAIIDDGGHAITISQPLVHDSALGTTNDGGLTKLGSGTLTLSAANTYEGPTTISQGTLALTGAGSISGSAIINVAAGAVLDAGGRNDETLTLASGQTLAGSGALAGEVIVGSGATLAPGGALTTLTFSNNLTLNGGSTTIMEISKPPLANDVARVAGTLTYGATLVITNIGAGAFAAGDSFKLFDAASYSGNFKKVVPAIPALSLAWDTNKLDNGILSVVSSFTPQPGFAGLAASGNNLVFSGTNGVPDWTYYVLSSTNLASPLDQWQRVATNAFDAGGDFGFTNPIASRAPQTFYRLQLQ